MDDAELEKMLYGSRTKQGGLTDAQEQVLVRDGAIPRAEDAERVLAEGEAESAELEAADEAGEDIQNLGHKWPLPQKPYPDGFNVKKRYHPVVEQVTRLMMRDGKLAAAQRVCLFYATAARRRTASCTNGRLIFLEPGDGDELSPNGARTDL